MEQEKTVIEINGIKMEIDLRHARKIESFRVGDKVRVLIKKYDSYASYAGMIVGFDNFRERPTIVIAYIETGSYSAEPLKFAYLNQDSKDIEIAAMVDDFIAADKSVILSEMDRCILDHKQKIEEMEAKKAYFLKYFGVYFETAEEGR